MLSILCPHCRAKLAIERELQGTTITCQSCSQPLAVPKIDDRPQVVEPSAPSLVVSTPRSSSNRRRKPALGNRLINVALHLSITAGAVYAGYYLVTHQRMKAPPEQAKLLQDEPTTAIRKPQPKKRRSPIPSEIPTITTSLVEPEPTEVVEETVSSPFETLAKQATLPPVEETQSVILLNDVDDPKIELLSTSSALSLVDDEVDWQANTAEESHSIAAMSIVDSALKFRWMNSVPDEAEASLRNSIVLLSEGDYQHHLVLRKAEFTSPEEIDLSKPQQRIVGRFAYLVPPEDVCFELLNLDELPAATVEGADPVHLKINDQTILEFIEADGTATRFTMKKRGKVAVVEIESRYALPSGYKQPMSIARGNSKLKELSALHRETLAAEAAIDGLRDRIKELEKDAKAVPRSRATVVVKAQRMQSLRAEAAAVQQKIAYAEQLISQKLTTEADLLAIQKVAQVAQQLHESRIAYRFFTVVDGHQIDLLVAR